MLGSIPVKEDLSHGPHTAQCLVLLWSELWFSFFFLEGTV